MILTLLSLLLLALPTLWEIWNDRKGDADKVNDFFIRIILLTVLSGPVVWIMRDENTNVWSLAFAFNLGIAIHFLFFDFIIAYILIKNGTLEPPRGVKYHWWTYQAKSGVIDNIGFWRNLNPWVKLGIRVAYFTIALILFL